MLEFVSYDIILANYVIAKTKVSKNGVISFKGIDAYCNAFRSFLKNKDYTIVFIYGSDDYFDKKYGVFENDDNEKCIKVNDKNYKEINALYRAPLTPTFYDAFVHVDNTFSK